MQIYKIKNYLLLNSSLISINKTSVEDGAAGAAFSFFWNRAMNFISKKITNAITIKLITAARNFPYVMAPHFSSAISFNPSLSSIGANIAGVMMSVTNEETIAVNAAPIITATARSITLPFIAKALKSFMKLMLFDLKVKEL